jgi:hypothetical protein
MYASHHLQSVQEGKGEIRYHIRKHGYSCQSSSVADQVLHGQSVDQLYTYENEHQDIKSILNSVQKYKMENEPINQNQPNWL